jgi:hypothetical protein
MNSFTLSLGGQSETFRPAEDFSDGHDRLHWTLSGIEKLIRLGVWRREYDLRGKLRTKPPHVETVIEAASRTKRKKSVIPPLSQSPR